MWGKLITALLTIIGLSSYKYVPFGYSVRFYWVAFKYFYLEKLSPVVKSPFTESIRKNKCCPLECDFFGFHKNNGTYFTELDLCRTECTLNAIHTYFKNCILNKKPFAYVPLASITNHFLKEIKPFQNYQMNTKIVGWGDKWFWLITVFTIKEKIKPIDPVDNEGKHVIENIPPLYLYQKDGDKIGNRVVCLSVGKIVFKKGRETLKPWDAFQLAGVKDLSIKERGNLGEQKVAEFTNNVSELLNIYHETV